jgi:hypothetical protein
MQWYEIALTVLGSILASNGMWGLIAKVADKKSDKNKLLMGLAYSEIINRAERYIERGYISSDEYHELDHYLYQPYKKMGGNGTAMRLMEKVEKLPSTKGGKE